MIENIVFGVLVVLAVGAGIFTYLYETGKFPKSSKEEQNTEQM